MKSLGTNINRDFLNDIFGKFVTLEYIDFAKPYIPLYNNFLYSKPTCIFRNNRQ